METLSASNPSSDGASQPNSAEAARLSLALAAANLGDWTWDVASDEVTLSPQAATIFGLPPGQMIAWAQLREYLEEGDRDRAKAAVEKAIAERSDYDIEYVVCPPAGSQRWISAKGRGVYDASGNVVGMIGVVQDVTAKRRREEAQRFLLRLSDTIRLIHDAKAVQWQVVSAAGMFFGGSRCTYGEIDRAQQHVTVERDYVQGVGSVAGQHRLEDFGPLIVQELKAGRTLVIDDVSTDPRLDSTAQASFAVIETRSALCVPLVKDHRFVAIFVLHHHAPRAWSADDVWLMEQLAERTWFAVERARADTAREASESRFRMLADAAPVLIWMADVDKQCSWVNQPWLTFTGRTREQEAGFGWTDGIHREDLDRCLRTYTTAFDARRPFTVEYRLRDHEGEYRWLLDNGVPLYSGAQFEGYVGSCVDIHARKLAEQEREQLLANERAARLEAERLNRTKDEFLSVVSHELRTPLNAIIGWGQLMQMNNLPPNEMRQGVDVIQRNARLQAQIIEDLLDMSRIVAGKMRLDVQALDLAAVVEEAIQSVRPAAAAKEIQLLADCAPGVASIRGDRQRLQQVVWNLLSNAVKFTPSRGRVQVSLRQAGSQLELQVADNGQGIDADFLPSLFERFRQADASTTRRHGGLGIGLALVKHLVELHGGQVRAESPGAHQGASFTVLLPIGAAQPEQNVQSIQSMGVTSPAVDLSAINVLIVDDEPDARLLIRRLLEMHGAHVTAAESANEALELFRQHPPDVLLSDIGMPQRDGYELIRDIRLLPPSAGRSTPAAALTAFARSEDRQRSMLAGFQAHIAKPVEAAELIAVVAMLAGRT